MSTAAEVLDDYRDRTGLDADDALALLLDFFTRYGMSDSAISTLCEHIDEEDVTADFTSLLEENGLGTGPG